MGKTITSTIKLYVGDPFKEVDLLNPKNITNNYSLRDLNDLSKRKTSFTNTFEIVRNKKSNDVFKSSFNVNSNSFDSSKKVQAILLSDGVEILKGSLYINEITSKSYSVTMGGDTLNLLTSLGDKLVYGNDKKSLDIHFSDSENISFAMTRPNVRARINDIPQRAKNVVNFGLTNRDIVIKPTDVSFEAAKQRTLDEVNQVLTTPKDIEFGFIKYDDIITPLADNEYRLLPSMKYKLLFDKIFKDNGYTYSLSSTLRYYLDHMMLPFNRDWSTISQSMKVTTLLLGLYTDSPIQYYGKTGETRNVKGGVGAWRYSEDKLYNDVKQSTPYTSTGNYIIPAQGTYKFDLKTVIKANREYDPNDRNKVTGPNIGFSIAVLPKGEKEFTISKIGDYLPSTNNYETHNFEPLYLDLFEGDKVCLQFDNYDKDTFAQKGIVMNPIGSELTITIDNYLYAGQTITLNEILPAKYKQRDIINDFFKMFNCFVESDPINPKKLIIRSYNEYFNDEILDITDRLDTTTIKVENTASKQAPKVLNLNYNEDNDVYNQDYKNKGELTLGGIELTNESNITKKQNNIDLSIASTAFITDKYMTTEYPVIATDKGDFKTDWKPRILFFKRAARSKIYGYYRWGCERRVYELDVFPTFSREHTIGQDESINLMFDTKDTYANVDQYNNNTLYNKNYLKQIKDLFDPNTRTITIKAYLKAHDLNVVLDFKKQYVIDSDEAGQSVCRLSEIKNYNVFTGECTLIFNTIQSSLYRYPDKTDTNKIKLSISHSSGRKGSSGSSSSGQQSDLTGFITEEKADLRYLKTSGGVLSGNLEVQQNVLIKGDLSVLGTGTTVDLQTLEIESNELVLNHSLGSTENPFNGLSGVRVNRGNKPDYLFQFDEPTNLFKIGKQSNLQAVATREDRISNRTIPYWDDATKMYKAAQIKYYKGDILTGKGGKFYNSENSNLDSIDWKAKTLFVGNGSDHGIIQVKHLSGAYGVAVGVETGNRVTLGKSSVTNGVDLYNGNVRTLSTTNQGIDINGEIHARLFYSGEVDDLNTIIPNVYRGLEVMRYSQDTLNKPITSNNANAVMNIYSHSGGYGKQIAFGDSDDLYIRRMTSGSFGGWKKLYHSGNANNQNTPWRASFMRVQDQQVIRGTTTNDRLQLWGSQPYMSFYNEATDNRDGYIQSHSGNMLIDVTGASNSIDFRIGGYKRASVSKLGFGTESGSVYRCFGKQGTSWNNYLSYDTAKIGALDVQLANTSDASWIWSVRGSSNTFKAGFQISNNSDYSQLYLSSKLKVTAWGDNFEFYVDGTKVAALDKDGNLRVKGTVQAHAL